MADVKTPKTRRLPRSVREEQVLDAAVTVFARHGYPGASVDEVAEVAQFSKPMVYAYIGTKEELFAACVRREAGRLGEAIARVVATYPGLDPQERMWRGLLAFFRYVGEHRDAWMLISRRARIQEPFAAHIAAMRTTVAEEVLAQLLGDVLSRYRVPADEVMTMAYALLGSCESLADRLVDHPEEDPEVIATRLMTFIWSGANDLMWGTPWRPPV